MSTPRNQPLGEAVEVSDGVFAYVQPDGSWWRNNTGFLVGSRGVVAIDSCSTELRTRAFLETVRRYSAQPVRTLINTHHHGDHTFGNCLFPGATIVAHERAREAMAAWGEPGAAPYWTPIEWGDVSLEMPFLTFTDRMTLWIDDLRCEVIHVGEAAHTTNDVVIWIPDRGVLFAGDLVFNGGTPFLLQGSVAGAIRVLRDVITPLGAEVIVGGHGPTCGQTGVDDALDYLHFVQEAAVRALETGQEPLDAARALDLGPFGKLTDPERIVGNLHRAMAELRGLEAGGTIDTGLALSEMMTFNGGPLDACGV